MEPRALPIGPIFFPVGLFGLGFCTWPVLMMASSGSYGFASMVALGIGAASLLFSTAGLVLVRARRSAGPALLVAGALLAFACSAYGIYRFEAMAAASVRGADEASKAVMRAHNDRERPWAFIGALVGMLPAVFGGGAGYALLRPRRGA